MSDLRVIRWLQTIDSKLDEAKADRARSVGEIVQRLNRHDDRLAGHDEKLDDHAARIERLEERFDRSLHAWRSGKKPPKPAKKS